MDSPKIIETVLILGLSVVCYISGFENARLGNPWYAPFFTPSIILDQFLDFLRKIKNKKNIRK